MAAGTTILVKGKSGVFTGGNLAGREIGLDTLNDALYASSDGVTVFQIGNTLGASSSTDHAIARFDSTGGKTLLNSAVTVNDSGTIQTAQGIFFTERADHVETPIATKGELWVKNDSPNSLIFTDDAGTDHDLTAAGGGGVSQATVTALSMIY